MGLTMCDLENLSYGDVVDMMIEAGNDGADYNQVAVQSDFDNF
jgi:hypothetical protein